MAAYAALVSVMHIIETIQNHPRPPISFDNEQLQSLTENITFLQEFLETRSIDDDGLDSRIADAAYAAEDVIESHIIDQIEASTNDDHGENISSADFYDGLHKVIQDLDLIRRDLIPRDMAMSFARRTGIRDDDDDDQLLHNNYSSTTSHFSTGHDTIVGLEDDVCEILDKLTWDLFSNRKIIPIVGMGGIGKTTLARNIYVNPLILHYFNFRGWATISQEYNSKKILLDCLDTIWTRENLREMSEDELGNQLYKSLSGRRYLIVLDDIWSIEAWHKVKNFFPNNNNGSAIMLTTRLSNLAYELGGSYCHEMSFLDEDKSWKLFCKIVFGERSYPWELENTGKKIVEDCEGLPLSIIVVGRLLAKSKPTKEYWQYIHENLNSILNLQEDERHLKILYLSYKELPVWLKPCFLYMIVFPEDYVIDVPDLMRLWVAEGFLKPIRGECLEVVAKKYFNELVGRILILVNGRGDSGEAKTCKINYHFMDICVREAQKHKFLFVARHHNFNDPHLNTQRRIAVRDDIKHEVIHAFLSDGTLVRSLTCKHLDSFPKSFGCRMLRVWNEFDTNLPFHRMHFLQNTNGIVNCRYISGLSIHSSNSTLPFSIFSLWNLQTLYVLNSMRVFTTSEIWKMSQLRHVLVDRLNLLDPHPSGHTKDEFVLGNLQTLSHVKNFKFSGDVVKRIPNIKKLNVDYEGIEDWSSCCINNLVRLINLESLYFAIIYQKNPISSFAFPPSLKELTLRGTNLDFGDLGTMIGSLQHLQVLKLYAGSFVGSEWETVEGQFPSLKHLEIAYLPDLIYWKTESYTHFPYLERLFLYYLPQLREIPSEIGATLKSIEIKRCCDSAVSSAKEMLMDQENLGNEGLQVMVIRKGRNPYVESLAASNFQVKIVR